MAQTTKSETWPLAKLKLWDRNPRSIEDGRFAELKARLERQGQIKPLLVTAKGVVIGGNMRLRAMQELGWTEAWVSVTDATTDKEIFDLALTDNEEFGYYDQQQVAELAVEIGFTPLELESYELNLGKPTALGTIIDRFGPEPEDDEELPELDKAAPANSKLGTVYRLGAHRLICGDATNEQHVRLLLGDVIPEIMVTDPPYGVDYDADWRDQTETQRANSKPGDVLNDDRVDWSQAFELFGGNIAYVWHSALHTDEVAASLRALGYDLAAQIVWVKQHFVLSRGDYHWQHEPCWYAVKKDAKHEWQGDRTQTTTWQIANSNPFTGKGNDDDMKTEHGTQKPVECMARPIRNNTRRGANVYDPFGGSGTTLVACEELKRTCFMVELDPHYCDLIRRRYHKLVTGREEGWEDATPAQA